MCALSIRTTNRFVDANTLVMALEAKENLVKMICSPASGVESLLGGLSHPEMFCNSVGGNDNSRHTRFKKKFSYCNFYFVPSPRSPNSERKERRKIKF